MKKMWKRTLSMLLVVLLVCMPFCLAAGAVEQPTQCADEEYDVTFTVPAGWTDASDFSNGEKQYVFTYDAFQIEDEDEADSGFSLFNFVYNAEDLYAQMDEQLQSRYTRGDLNSQTMTVEDFQAIEDAVGDTESEETTNMQITKEKIGDLNYFKITATVNVWIIPGELTMFVRLHDGDSFAFGILDYSGMLEGNTDVDFDVEQSLKSIVQTVKYNRESPIEEIPSGADSTKATGEIDASSSESAGWIAVAAAVVIAAAVCVVIVARKKKSRAASLAADGQVEPTTDADPDESVMQTAPADEPDDTLPADPAEDDAQ